ncbi:GNAT family N-acetyltransferase [Sulfitobacter sp. W002]|uniref:GNAT family N-acetyltransferase n=1 Tax=Sulfitobacter sp. W002 TaxID=2867024 RepID=UPI0021A7C9A0|nr:GNAT family N-acetyltransferase [Sulfitobacter sp. W002]UWR30867.1 GNAT family N-acetyltransferase [Sulfitobacter sp. W002]
MTPAALAALHAAAFTQDRPWQEAEFTSLLDSPFVELFTRPGGFALTRTIAGESELLTLAVAPARQRQGLGRALLRDWLAALPADCDSAFLEVAADNLPARALYADEGFAQIAIRRAYYARKDAAAVDACILRRMLTRGHCGDPAALPAKSG